MIFIDLKKAYDKILRNIIGWALEKKDRVSTKYINIINDIYIEVVTSIRVYDDE
jgi:hypothetical protein